MLSFLSITDPNQVEELELKAVDINTYITDDDLATAMSSSVLNGFTVTSQDKNPDEPCHVFQKETVFDVAVNDGAHILGQLFPPNVCSKRVLKQLTRNCKGKGFEKNLCRLGVEVYTIEGPGQYRACPTITIQIDPE